MKLIMTAVAFATLTGAMVSAAEARPHHHPVCKWVYDHHHKVKRCH